MTHEFQMEKYKNNFEKFIKNYIESLSGVEKRLFESIKYSLFSGGKRIRPVIMLAMYELCGGKSEEIIYKFASAVEMIHTYSLIHDDLPCMDDDTMRRGKACNHIVYGEDTALLAGDALLTLAFETVSSISCDEPDIRNILKSINILAKAAGCGGMVSGQCLDLSLSNGNLSKEKLMEIYKLKTAALISAAAEIGAILSGATNEKIIAAKNYGENIGICFQLVDDILDNETSNISLFKDDNAENSINKLTSRAKNELNIFEKDTSFLKYFADFLTSRTC